MGLVCLMDVAVRFGGSATPVVRPGKDTISQWRRISERRKGEGIVEERKDSSSFRRMEEFLEEDNCSLFFVSHKNRFLIRQSNIRE